MTAGSPAASDPAAGAEAVAYPPARRLIFGTTSYVLPADLVPNVRVLAPFVDDVELVLFEGDSGNLPTRQAVREIGRMGADGGCGFSVHLPLDVGIGELDPAVRRRAEETCLRVIDLTLELEPHAYVVHPELPLRYHPALGEPPRPLESLPPAIASAWLGALGQSLAGLSAAADPFPLAVENLQFAYRWVAPLLEEHDLGVTMDVGHLLLAGGRVASHLEEFGERLTVVHLHGVVGGRDHQQLGAFPPQVIADILAAIARSGAARPAWMAAGDDAGVAPVVVSLEVFGLRPTVASLGALADVLAGAETGSVSGVPEPRAAAARLRAAAHAVLAALPELDSVVEEG